MDKRVLNVLRFLAMFLFLVAVAAIAGETRFFIPSGNRTTNTDYVVPVVSQPTRGFLAPATATFSVPQDKAVKIPVLPIGTKQLRIYANPGADINFGPADVASGTAYPEIASGSLSDSIVVGTINPDIYLIGRDAPATATLICQ